jgi:hypothetical protein
VLRTGGAISRLWPSQATFSRAELELLDFTQLQSHACAFKEVSMSNVYIEYKRKLEEYVATQNGRTIGRGDTQAEAVDQARRNRQQEEDPSLAERQRLRDGKPHPDKWRRTY